MVKSIFSNTHQKLKMSESKKYLEIPQKDGFDAEIKKPYGLGIRHLQMLCMTFCMVALFIARSCMGVAILAMTDTERENTANVQIYPWDKKTQGIVLSSFFWGYVMMQIPAGSLAKRFGGKPMLEAALLISCIICLITPICAQLGGWYLVCACRMIMGLSQACLFSSCHTLLGKWLPASERTTYIGFVYGGSPLGTIIAMPVSGVLAETALGWKMIFYSMAILCFIVFVLWHFLAASSPREHRWTNIEEIEYIEQEMNISVDTKKVQRIPWKEIMTSRGMFAIMASHIGSTFAFILIFVDLPTFLEKGLNESLHDSASLSAIPYAGMWLGGIISSFLSKMVLDKKMMSVHLMRKFFNSIAFFGQALALIMLSFLGPETKHWAVVSLVAAMAFQGFSNAGYMANFLDISPNFGGVMLSITNFFANLGAVFTPIITSFILKNDPTDLSRWRVVFLLFASLIIFVNIIYVIFGTSTVAPWDDPDYFNTCDSKLADEEKKKKSEISKA